MSEQMLDLELLFGLHDCAALRAAHAAEQAAMIDLLTAAVRRLGQNTHTTCAAMLLALQTIGDAMPESDRRELAHSMYLLAKRLAQTEDGE